jgi:uridylate kinase
MKYAFGKTIVVALGGSIVYPDGIDVAFVKQFRSFALSFIKRKHAKLVIVIGGGRLARVFQDAAGKIAPVVDEDKDWIGIHATRLNAHLLRTIFKHVADPVVIDTRHKIKKLKHPITIAAGWRPGWSTDYVASQLASDFGAKEVIIAGKPSHVYNKDPHKHENASPIERLSWKEYRRLVPKKWVPGLSSPVDPIASALGERAKLKAIIVNGKDLKNFSRLLNGQEFKGSVIG